MHDTLPRLMNTDFPAIRRKPLEIIQANITLQCNQQCVHCHVNASPKRTEFMSEEIIHSLIEILTTHKITTLDITGGAPELHPRFTYLVTRARELGVHVIDRCNLTILLEPGMEDLARFLAEQQVEIIASLPCYLEENVDRQRGKGVFQKSIAALQKLNALGYGDAALPINLVYNPQGPVLPPQQQQLQEDYKKILREKYNIRFNQLFTLCNMPIKRFGSTLISTRQFDAYIGLLKQAYKHENLDAVMCRNLISVGWQGELYDCDFNQMLGLNMSNGRDKKLHISDLLKNGMEDREIIVGDHCYGCTAGQGSSCGGALNPD